MTKKIITLLIAGVITISVLTGCGSGTITSSETETVPKIGYYELFFTDSSTDYLNFLNTFNEENYEIVDISHWYVTYKIKE